ncbi:Peroxin 13, N-terminal region-domain-containing protein [Scheffersomyces xylosifermentans]|uniref:Peroxin 13, N-terminal region-domain-containing protein n=1 Tax=Scheffersomyces xylosifermentans TaxID=1304137 RepID=UPI00315DA217
MSSVPRTKPWEVSSGTSSATAAGGASATAIPSNTSTGIPASTLTGSAPIPERPTSLTSDFNTMANSSPYGATGGYGATTSYGNRYGMGSTGYGSSMYGSGLGSGMYGSSMYGGYGSSMYGGGYGSSMYGMGGYGSGMYGMGGYGSGMYGQQGMPGPLGEGTQATFHLIESIIGAVGGFAQMLEATYMATHSSFFTMVSLAEQFGNLKNALGSLLGIYALIAFVKKIFYKVTGQTYNYGMNLKEFSKFEKQQKKLEDNIKRQQQGGMAGSKPRISFKPLLLFLAASIGFPYLLSKAIQKLNEQNQRRQQEQHQLRGPGGAPLDPANLQFAKTLYEFNPENPNMEIELKPNELVAVLSKLDPVGNESKWWKVRSRSGKVGYVPSNYLSVIERKPAQVEPAPPTPLINQPQQAIPALAPGSADINEKAFNEFQKNF